MNDGGVRKIIVTMGSVPFYSIDNILKKIDNELITHIRHHELSSTCIRESLNFFIVSCSDFNRKKVHLIIKKYEFSGIFIINNLRRPLIDINPKSSSIFIIEAYRQLSYIFEAVSLLWNHFSVVEVDWSDIKLCLNTGKYFQQEKITNIPVNNLSLSLHELIQTMKYKTLNSNLKLEAVIGCIIGGFELSFEVFEDCNNILASCNAYTVLHTNLSIDCPYEINVLYIYNKLRY